MKSHMSDISFGPGHRCFIIGEVAQAHDGSLGMAHAFIDAIARAGADAVKFQTHLASAESTSEEPWRVKFSLQDRTRFDYWKRMEFKEDEWRGLKKHAGEKGLKFLSSPFSVEAVEMLTRIGVAAWKMASGELSNTPMLERIVSTGLPVLLSTGMSPLNEIDNIIDRLQAHGVQIVVLQCTSTYPCPAEKVGLNLIPFFRKRYHCGVGLSDHSGTVFPGLAGATLGIDVLEVHVTLSREMFGPDVSSSLTTSELTQLVDGVRFIEKMNANPVDKDLASIELFPMRKLFTRSVALRVALPAGTVLQEDHLTLKKPGTGIPPAKLSELVGRKVKRDIEANTLLSEDDLE
jgi:N-acetylneuraminate synthase